MAVRGVDIPSRSAFFDFYLPRFLLQLVMDNDEACERSFLSSVTPSYILLELKPGFADRITADVHHTWALPQRICLLLVGP